MASWLTSIGFLAAQLTSGVSLDVAAGRIPVQAGLDPEATVAANVVPELSLSLSEPRERALVRYAPRISWRSPNVADSSRPLQLHQANGVWRAAATRRTTIDLEADVAGGEFDYASAQRVLGADQSALPNVDRLLAIQGEGEASVSYAASRRWLLSCALFGNRSQSLRSEDEDVFPTTVDLRLRTTAARRLTPRATLSIGVDGGYQRLSESRLSDWGARLGLISRLSRELSLELGAGALYVIPLNDAAEDASIDTVLPTASAALLAVTASRRLRVDHRLALTVEPRVDPVLGSFLPRFTFEWQSGFTWTEWSLRLDATVSANVSDEPLPNDPDEAIALTGAVVDWRPHPNHRLFASARAALRNAHLSLGLDPRPLEYLGSIGYQLLIGTPRISNDLPAPTQ